MPAPKIRYCVCSRTPRNKRKRYCSDRCKELARASRQRQKQKKQLSVTDSSNNGTQGKRKFRCKKCRKKYEAYFNDQQCEDCWRKYTRGTGAGGDTVSLKDLGWSS